MAQITAVIGITHFPFHHRLASQPREQWSEDTITMAARGEMARARLSAAKPDLLVTIGNDHFHQFFLDNMPAFTVGKMTAFDGIYYNETREFGLPRCRVPGDTDAAQKILVGGMKQGVDFAFSNELKIDHSIIVPLLFVRPEMDIPIVPVLTNCMAPPMPTAERFFQVGKILRSVIEDLPGNRRVGVVLSGHLSLDVGGPLQFEAFPVNPEFDAKAVGWIEQGDSGAAIAECTFEKLLEAGNVAHGFLNFLLAMGLTQGMRCTHAEAIKRKASSQPLFCWEP